MTFKAPDKLPYDAWFDENPLKDSKYIDTPTYCLLYTSDAADDL